MTGHSSTFLTHDGPRIFSMPPDVDFQGALVRGILDAVARSDNPFALHDVIILAPTRRSVRSLSESFLRHGAGKPAVLLPRIVPIGDVDAEAAPFVTGDPSLLIPPAIPPAQRIFALLLMVQRKAQTSGQDLPLASALAEAQAVAQLLESAAHERIHDFSPASDAFAQYLANMPEHVQRSARFLEIIGEVWPQYLADQGMVDGAERNAQMIEKLIEAWTIDPPPGIVIAAGSTGTDPAVARLLRLVAGLEKGAVILPGLDVQLPETDWEPVRISPQHPQYAMARLLDGWGLTRNDVRVWPAAKYTRFGEMRRRIIHEALKPADTTDDWVERLGKLSDEFSTDASGMLQQAFTGLSLIETDTEEEEAQVLALAIRHRLETPDARIALITPDRVLARRVRAQLQRFAIDVDDSAGQPLPEDPLGTFLALVWRWYMDPADPARLLSLLRHDLCGCGLPDAQLQTLVQALDRHALRGVRRHGDLSALAENLDGHTPDRARVQKLLAQLQQWIVQPGHECHAGDWAKLHVQLAENLAGTDARPGSARLWLGHAGESAANLFRSLMEEGPASGPVAGPDYWVMFEHFARQAVVRRAEARTSRVRILGPLEARLQSADLVLLAGLNENVWPSPARPNPFLPRSLLQALGLPDPEQRIGQSAHDFAENACKPHVILTRARRQDGAPSVASRWLWRLQTLARAGGLGDPAELWKPETDYVGIARTMLASSITHPAPEPRPCPPVEKRPFALYVTRIETLIRNPYAIYGQKVLGLNKLDPVGLLADARERGNAWHKALEIWKTEHMQTGILPDGEKLFDLAVQALAEEGFTPAQMAAERIRAKQMVERILPVEQELIAQGVQPVLLEQQGHWEFQLKSGQAAKVSAKADRIDRGVEGLQVVDYKSTSAKGKKEVAAGFAPQLPLTGVILRHGGFADLKSRDVPITGMAYWLTGKSEDNLKVLELAQGQDRLDMDEALAEAEDRVRKLYADFSRLETPYLCQPRAKFTDSFSDFDHLARRTEWDSQIEGEGGGE